MIDFVYNRQQYSPIVFFEISNILNLKVFTNIHDNIVDIVIFNF